MPIRKVQDFRPDNFDWAEGFMLTEAEAEKISHPDFIINNLIIRGHLIVIPSQPNGGKTTIFFHLAGDIAEQGFNVMYVHADTSGGDAKPMIEEARERGFVYMTPDALVDELNRQTTLIRRRDLSRAEDMLASQVHLLDQLFSKLVNVGMQNLYQYPKTAETFLKLAMKAQGQCRTSWEAISKIQNPPVTNHVQQQNVAHNQQINNRPNQLSGDSIELLPDKSHEGSPAPFDTSGETVGEIHRSEDTTGQT